ncbi:MAG: hypothetical protein JAY96_13115, partial [Candidatus Thiodiazotropha endolucinida]|nr:hypothetical protein [Candidatus Thiodiazotropha taylori]MCW4249130.1 hypothetical protein [Candidatus Thiodiazotropha endolucinida]
MGIIVGFCEQPRPLASRVTTEEEPVKIKAVSLSVLIALAGLTSQLMAEERADVLERIAPIGKVSVTGEAKPAAAPATQSAAAEAPAAEAPATEAPAAEAAPTAEAASAAGGDALALATQSGCMACHQVATKVV